MKRERGCQQVKVIGLIFSFKLIFRQILQAKNTKKYSKKGKKPFLIGKNTKKFLKALNNTIPLYHRYTIQYVN